MTTELTIITDAELKFDKNDIAAIAVAEAEKKMRTKIKKLRAQMSDTEQAIENIVNEIQTLGETAIEQKIKGNLKTIQAGLKATKIKNFIVDFTTHIDVFSSDEIDSTQAINEYNINLFITDKKKSKTASMSIEHDSFTATQLQRAAMKKYGNLLQQKADLTSESLDWRRKLGDIAAFERQIKATLAKRQIESAKGGKELLRDLLKNYESDLMMLGE